MTRYVVLEEIGRGGMGRVLRAYDPKLQREVALKEVRSDVLGPAGAQRLIAEARAMAKLSHPNVVAVYDVEEIEHGQVVLVMEYVAGQTLTEWLRRARPWRDVVAHFRWAGRGLAAAHAAGLLHRDFKPDNVLVGADGRVRVTDFGLARELLPENTDEPSALDPTTPPTAVNIGQTAPGAIVGTLPYLAPERLVGAPADAASDQYAYCVALWEALFGERPFLGQSIVELAFAMSAGRPRPPPHAPRVPAWLFDTIARGLANDSRERWPDMQVLLTALAYDPARRRRRWLQAAGGLGVLGLGASAVQAWTTARAQRCTEAAATAHMEGAWDEARRAEVKDAVLGIGASYAADVWTRTEETLDAYGSAWTNMHVETCEATTVRGEQSAAVMDLRMACLHRADVELSAVTQVLARADAQTVQKAHEILASLRPLERCADVEALQADVEPPLTDEADAVATIREHIALGWAELKAGHNDKARHAVDAAQTELAAVSYGPVQTELAVVEGWLLDQLGDYEAAHTALRRAVRLASTWRQPRELQHAASYLLYVVGYRLQRFDEGLRYADLAGALAEGDPVREARVSRSIAIVLDAQAKFTESEAEHRRGLKILEDALGPDHTEVAYTRFNLASCLWGQGKFAEAEAESRRALTAQENALGPEHPVAGASRQNLAMMLQAQGRYDEAEIEYRRALAVMESARGPDHPDVATSRHNLATLLLQQDKPAEAETEHRRALAVLETAYGPDHTEVAGSRHDLALVMKAQGKHEDAKAEFRRAIAILEKTLGPDHPNVAQARFNLGTLFVAQKKLDEAEAEYRPALAVMEKALDPDHPYLAVVRTTLAAVLLERGAVDEARPLAEAAWARRQRDDMGASERAATAFVLARAWWDGGKPADRARAIELAERSLADYAAAGEADGAEATEAKAWLEKRRSG